MMKNCDCQCHVKPTFLHPITFNGESSEIPSYWLKNFQSCSEFNEWSKNDTARAFGNYLRGSAWVWFWGLPDSTRCYPEYIFEAFEQKYCNPTSKIVNSRLLSKRKQQPYESVEGFVSDLEMMLVKSNKSEESRIDELIRGLQPPISQHVATQCPVTFESAVNSAKLAECYLAAQPAAVVDEDLNQILRTLKEKVEELVEQVDAFALQQNSEIKVFQSEYLQPMQDKMASLTKNGLAKDFNRFRRHRFDQHVGGICFYCGHSNHKITTCRFVKRDKVTYVRTTAQTTGQTQGAFPENITETFVNESGIYETHFW